MGKKLRDATVDKKLRLRGVTGNPATSVDTGFGNRGEINMRGNVVTVIDTRKRFGLKSKTPDDLARIIVTEVNGTVIGLLVDCVTEVVDLNQSEIEPSPTSNNDDSSYYIQGVSSRSDDSLLILVDINKLIDLQSISHG